MHQREGEALAQRIAVTDGTPVFRFLSTEERALLDRVVVTRTYEPGALLAQAGENWPFLLRVLHGEIRVCKFSADGRCLVPKTLECGEYFWGRPLFRNEPMPVFLEAVGQTEVQLWAYRDLLPVVQHNPQAIWDLCQGLSDQMMRAADYIESLAFQPLSSRLARLLLIEFTPMEGSPQMRVLSLDQMAAQIGSSREVVCRLLHGFEQSGLLALTRTELMITNLRGLKETAGVEKN